MTTILLVDDEQELLQAFEQALRKQPFELLTATSAESGLNILAKHRVDVVISDQQMPGLNGIEFLALAHQHWPDVKRIMLTGRADMDLTIEAINSSKVCYFLQKPCPSSELIETIYKALATPQAETRYKPNLIKSKIGENPKPAITKDYNNSETENLSNREAEILALLSNGSRVKGIAQTLDISPHTVRNHLKSLFRKMGVHSQEALISKGREISLSPK